MLFEALARMPHRGEMRLIDQIVTAGADEITCICRPHGGADYPLRIGGKLYGSILVELGAQAAAAHASLFGIGSAHMGLVLSLSNTVIHCQTVECLGPIEAKAQRLRTMEGASSYQFYITSGDLSIVQGDVLLSIQEMPG